MSHSGIRFAVIAVLAACSASAQAAVDQFELELRASAGYTDNVDRTGVGERSSSMFAVGARVDIQEQSARLDTTVAGDLDFVTYSEDDTDDQVIGNLYAGLEYGFVPERFTWVVSNSYGQGRLSLTSPSSPSNLEGINYFSTGPNLMAQLSQRTFLSLNARYANAWYEDGDGDSNQYSGGIALGRNLSEISSVSLNASYVQIDYDDAAFSPDLDLIEYYLGYVADGARTQIKLDAGYRTIDDGTDSDSGPLLRMSVNRDLSAYVSVFLNASSEYGDQAGLMRSGLSGTGGGSYVDGYSNGQVFEDRSIGAGINFARSRTRLGASVSYHDQNYRGDTSDNERTEFNLLADRELGPRWGVGTNVRLWREDYPGSNATSDESTLSLYARCASARTFGARAEWTYWDRSSDFGDAHENRVWLRLTWQPVKRGR